MAKAVVVHWKNDLTTDRKSQIIGMDIKIRKIKPADFEQIFELIKEFARFEGIESKITNSIERMNAEKDFITGFVTIVPSNKIVGYSTYFFAYYTASGKSIYMDDLYVKQDFRKLGIGKLLLNEVVNTAKQENCKQVRWQVSNWNKKAIVFYKSLGAQIDTVDWNCNLILEE